jgi:hypothetical protein
MALRAFDTAIVDNGETLVGPWRAPQQMLAAQVYDGHVSIHDNAMAQKVGFRAATIEGPTHFSQFDPLCERLWGDAWFETGCISAHYRNAVFAGEDVQAVVLKPKAAQSQIDIRMTKRDGTEVLQGTASVGRDQSATALDRRLRAEIKPLTDPVILRDVKVGMKTPRQSARMDFDQTMGELYPFSLRDKLNVITEPSPLYQPDRAAENKWRRAIIPFEMLSVLFQYRSKDDRLPIKGPAVGLFADQEIRLLDGPLFVGESYELEREVVAISASRRTESLWVRSSVIAPPTGRPVATMLLNLASIKDSLPGYAETYAALYG